MHNILFALWFFLPAGLGNASPVFSRGIKALRFLDKPMDFGLKFRGQRIFGKNKTWVGIIFAVLVGLITIGLQKYGFNHYSWVRSISGSIDYSLVKIWLLGPLLAFGALFGDAVESFLKRQFKIKPGRSWFPFDQVDYIIGGLIFSLIVIRLSWTDYLLIVVVWVLIHLISSYIGYLLGLKPRPI